MEIQLGLFEEYKLQVVAKDHSNNEAHLGPLSIATPHSHLISTSFEDGILSIFSKDVEGVATVTISSTLLKTETIIVRIRGKR